MFTFRQNEKCVLWKIILLCHLYIHPYSFCESSDPIQILKKWLWKCLCASRFFTFCLFDIKLQGKKWANNSLHILTSWDAAVYWSRRQMSEQLILRNKNFWDEPAIGRRVCVFIYVRRHIFSRSAETLAASLCPGVDAGQLRAARPYQREIRGLYLI